jgi:hypothetical protein
MSPETKKSKDKQQKSNKNILFEEKEIQTSTGYNFLINKNIEICHFQEEIRSLHNAILPSNKNEFLSSEEKATQTSQDIFHHYLQENDFLAFKSKTPLYSLTRKFKLLKMEIFKLEKKFSKTKLNLFFKFSKN